MSHFWVKVIPRSNKFSKMCILGMLNMTKVNIMKCHRKVLLGGMWENQMVGAGEQERSNPGSLLPNA